jgi:hypothetical protein
MSFSIDHILNGNLSTIIDYLNDSPNIENFAVGGIISDNTSIKLDKTKISNLSEATKNIDSSMMIENSAKLLKSVINNVVSKNQSSLLQLLSASNNISIANVGGDPSGDLKLTNVNQQNVMDITSLANFAQETTNDITTQITEEASKQFTKTATTSALTATSSSVGDTLGKAMDTVNALGSDFIQGATSVLDGSAAINAGNTSKTTTITETENSLKNTFNLNESFKITTNEDFNNAVSNQLSTENLASCGNEAAAKNNIDLANINKKNVIIDAINQSNIVTAALDCAFNQEVVNKLATIFVTNYSNLIDNMIQNSDTSNSGDVIAAGNAGAAMICAAGTALSDTAQGIGSGLSTTAQGLGSGLSTGAQGLGSGVSTGVQGIGSGVGTAVGGIGSALALNPISVVSCCFVLIGGIAAAGYVLTKKKDDSGSSNTESGDGDSN